LSWSNENAIEMLGTSDSHLDSYNDITIKNGTISINHQISRLLSSWENTTTFKYETAKKKWFLYTEHYTSYAFKDDADMEKDDMEKVTDELKTCKDFGVISLEDYTIYSK